MASENKRSLPAEANGAVHADLMGSPHAFRFRPKRLHASTLNFDVHCTFSFDERKVGPLPVADISPTGVAVHPPDGLVLTPGSSIEKLEVLYRNSSVWEGEAESVYQVDSPSPRLGLRFSSQVFDLHLLAVSDSVVESQLDHDLELHEQSLTKLPSSWRAAVAAFRRLLEGVRELLKRAEDELDLSSPTFRRDELAIFNRIFSKWAPSFYELQSELTSLSSSLAKEDQDLARSYATAEILPLFYPSPMYRRAHEKPLGYAGDFELMRMYFGNDFSGNSSYARFLQFLAQRYPLGRTVESRERTLRQKVQSTISANQATRIVSLACGPAIEIQNALASVKTFTKPVEFVLVDQDEQTMHYCHDALSRTMVERSKNEQSLVQLNCLNISIKQILQPVSEVEARFISDSLRDATLIYATGLFDYLPKPIAGLLLKRIYEFLSPGGVAFIGNLRNCPTSTWIMEYVLAWHLQYRTEADMLALASHLKPSPVSLETVTDDTGLCIFLEIQK